MCDDDVTHSTVATVSNQEVEIYMQDTEEGCDERSDTHSEPSRQR